MREIIFATGNENKMREIREIFEGLPFVIHSLKEAGLVSDPEENGATFAENAFIKAEAVHALRPDAIVMSDDSGLSVDYLNGEPGVFSARWLGRDTSYTEKNAELIRRPTAPGFSPKRIWKGGLRRHRRAKTASAMTPSSTCRNTENARPSSVSMRKTQSATAARRCGRCRKNCGASMPTPRTEGRNSDLHFSENTV